MTKAFLDTTVIISAVTGRALSSLWILEERDIERYTNEYVIKEVRRVLKKFQYNPEQINKVVEHVREKCLVLSTPSKEEIKKILIQDKSDRPIVYSAKKAGCILITDDGGLRRSGKKYVKTQGCERFYLDLLFKKRKKMNE